MSVNYFLDPAGDVYRILKVIRRYSKLSSAFYFDLSYSVNFNKIKGVLLNSRSSEIQYFLNRDLKTLSILSLDFKSFIKLVKTDNTIDREEIERELHHLDIEYTIIPKEKINKLHLKPILATSYKDLLENFKSERENIILIENR